MNKLKIFELIDEKLKELQTFELKKRIAYMKIFQNKLILGEYDGNILIYLKQNK